MCGPADLHINEAQPGSLLCDIIDNLSHVASFKLHLPEAHHRTMYVECGMQVSKTLCLVQARFSPMGTYENNQNDSKARFTRRAYLQCGCNLQEVSTYKIYFVGNPVHLSIVLGQLQALRT